MLASSDVIRQLFLQFFFIIRFFIYFYIITFISFITITMDNLVVYGSKTKTCSDYKHNDDNNDNNNLNITLSNFVSRQHTGEQNSFPWWAAGMRESRRANELYRLDSRTPQASLYGRSQGDGTGHNVTHFDKDNLDAQREREETLRVACAGKVELRYCPACATPVIKDGGCNQVSCPCGHTFRWPDARPPAPCSHCHVDRSMKYTEKCRYKTCAHCSKRAHYQAAIYRAGATALMVPCATASVLSVVTAGAAVVGFGFPLAVVTAAAFGPPALCWETVRRIRGKPKWKGNRLAKAARSGTAVASFGAFVITVGVCGWDSDN